MRKSCQPVLAESGDDRLERRAEPAFKHYSQYAGIWRSWVIGTAGAAIFLLLNKELCGQIPTRLDIARLWLYAAGIQVLLGLLNKHCAYAHYASKLNDTSWYLFIFDWLNRFYIFDLVADLLSLWLMIWAAWRMYSEYPAVTTTMPS